MKGLKELLRKEEKRLERIVELTKKQLENKVEGNLRLSKSHGCPQYYHCTKDNKLGTYIAKDNEQLIKRLIQKAYDEKVLRLVEKRLKQINRITKDYEDDEIEQLFLMEHPERKRFIKPIELPWEQKLAIWKAKEYKGKDFQDEVPVIMSERGERVRSKSEKIMADYFYRNGIEYKYECPLYLKGMGIIYPDFTFLSRKTGEEIYWEHNGRMDDPVYSRNAIRKINAYENNGIFQGERLILTYETEKTILNTGKIEQLVKRYLV